VTSVESEKPFDIFFGRTQKVRLSKKKTSFFIENEEKKASLADIFSGRTRHMKKAPVHRTGAFFMPFQGTICAHVRWVMRPASDARWEKRSEFQAVRRGGTEIPGTARRREAITRGHAAEFPSVFPLPISYFAVAAGKFFW